VANAAALAVAAGFAFGVVLICFSETREEAGLWPVLIAHLTAVPVLLLGVSLAGKPRVPPPAVRRTVVGSGLLDVSAAALLVVALRQDLVTLVAPAANLYPAFTVLLARVVLHERLARIQIVGLLMALVGLILLATG
jgi:drug/metabolite transporter (DMT)-like permease